MLIWKKHFKMLQSNIQTYEHIKSPLCVYRGTIIDYDVVVFTFIYAAEMHKVYIRDILFSHTVLWEICVVLGWINL